MSATNWSGKSCHVTLAKQLQVFVIIMSGFQMCSYVKADLQDTISPSQLFSNSVICKLFL